MRTLTKTILTSALLLLVAAVPSNAQFGASSASIRDLVRRIQTDTNTLRSSIQNASDRGNYRVNDLNQLITTLDSATTNFDRRLVTRRATSADARSVLDSATPIDSFIASNRVNQVIQRNWQTVRSDLDQLALAYNLNWQWNNSSSPTTGSNSNLSDFQLRQLVQRIDTRTTTFSRSLRADLTTARSNRNDRYSRDQVTQQLSSFEMAVVQLRNRSNSRLISSSDVDSLLQSASILNGFVNDRQLSSQTETSWSQLRPDLDQLATAFNVSANWSTSPDNGSGGNYPGNYPSRGGNLTGTYRIASSQSDDPRRAVDDATRNLSQAERQRVYDSLLRRLDPPEMLAIDRRGTSVTIASTRAQQISFVADGREQVETTQSGRTVRVKAQFTGDELSISRTGDRADDFTVNFDLQSGGRQLVVTRSLSSDRLSQAVTVRTYYDRSSDVAQLNIYDTNRENSNGNNTDVSGTFVVPNGTQLVAVLNDNLTTENAQANQRFTMTVRSPGQYDGATIEGYVSSIDRGGRVSGRSQMTLDFDTIRTRDGRSYRFSGIIDSVRTPSGEIVKVDNEGAIRDNDQTNKTVTRTAIGTAVGALIGAIAGGGKGAAIGAVVGAGAGAGSVYVQGRNDLDLTSGSEVTVTSTGPRG
ncbi:MAG TPA: YMGG-like glycine zipper-containing protein [Pyrinomonadaceae bacterium]